MQSNYETVIGLEIHVQLATKSKAFCSDATTFGSAPNTQVSAISLGHPGTLPRLNIQQVEYATRLGLALGSEINLRNSFDRKNYFYADLPKGYQITQDRQPICIGGLVPITVNGVEKNIRIHHIHMEEDAGKSIHDQTENFSKIDLNRSGVPLLEIVTEPDLRSAEEVDALMTGMRQLVRYLGVSDGNMQEGSMRCDCNISIRPMGVETLGNRCEVKNLNSMRYARQAIAFEVNRQLELVESGGVVLQETLNFDPVSGKTTPIRSKEDAKDYRYFPDPDLLPVQLSADWVTAQQEALPMLPWETKKHLMSQYGLSEYDATLVAVERETADFFEQIAAKTKGYKAISNLLINKIIPWANEHKIVVSEFPVSTSAIVEFLELIENNKLSHSTAYQDLLPALIDASETKNVLALADKMNLLQSDNANELQAWVDAVIAENEGKVAAYQKGKKGLIGFFMGQVMQKSGGKADPKKANALLRKKLG